MKPLSFLFLLLLPALLFAQDMRVYTVAGKLSGGVEGDNIPATDAKIVSTEGIWMDSKCNIYFCEGSRIRKVTANTGIITTIIGTWEGGFSGDGGPATAAKTKVPYGLFVADNDDIYFVDGGNNRIRKIDAASGIVTTFAGGGSSSDNNIPATDARLTELQGVFGDNDNIYIGFGTGVKKVDIRTRVITTLAGNNSHGFSGDGGPATNAQFYGVAGMILDDRNNLFVADRGNHRIRKINTLTGLVATVAGTTDGYSGDGGLAVNAQLSGPISFVIDKYNNIIIGDNQNNLIRKVDAITGKISKVAGVGITVIGSYAEGATALSANIHPEFMYLDGGGNIYFSNYSSQIRKITGFAPTILTPNSCGATSLTAPQKTPIWGVYPNPFSEVIDIYTDEPTNCHVRIENALGYAIFEQKFIDRVIKVPANNFLSGIYFVKIYSNKKSEIFKILKI